MTLFTVINTTKNVTRVGEGIPKIYLKLCSIFSSYKEHFNMGLLTKEAVVFFGPVKRKFKRCMANNDSMATKGEQNRQQDDKDHSRLIISQVIAVRGPANLQITASETEGANSQNPGPAFGERIDHQRLLEETERRFFNETVCTRWKDSSSDLKQNSWLDLYQEKQMHHKITNAQDELSLPDDETRLVNGLLTTTLCSTEL